MCLPDNQTQNINIYGITNYRKTFDLVIVDEMHWPKLGFKGTILSIT